LNKKLFIGNLGYDVTDAQLSELFAQAGKVESAVVITDRRTGRSKGFGFVEMSTEKEAEKAIEMLNGKDFQGREIVVKKPNQENLTVQEKLKNPF